VIKYRKKGTTSYKPDWSAELDRMQRYFKTGGEAHVQCSRHELALQNAIKTYIRDPEERRDFMSAVLASNAGMLRYSCPQARVLWAERLIYEFIAAEVKGPIFTFTLILDWFSGSTKLPNGLEAAKLLTMKSLVELVFKNSGYSVLGHSEEAIFPKRENGDGYDCHAHAQFLVWGKGKKSLGKLLEPIFPALQDGTYGYYGEEITRTPTHALSYATKAPAYGYSAWPKASGGNRHSSAKLPSKGHFQFLHIAQRIVWPDLCIAVGDGVKIKDRALKTFKAKFPASTCRSADNFVRKPAPSKKPASTGLTVDTKVPAKFQAHTVNSDLRLQIGEAADNYNEYDGHRQNERAALYRFLASAYKLALTSNLRREELEEIARELKLPFNARTDLFAFAIRMAIHGKKQENRQLISDWSRALRYLFQTGCPIPEAEKALRDYGVRDSARSAQPGNSAASRGSLKKDWTKIRKAGSGFKVKTNVPKDLPRLFVMFGSTDEDRTSIRARHTVSAKDPVVRRLIKEIAKKIGKGS